MCILYYGHIRVSLWGESEELRAARRSCGLMRHNTGLLNVTKTHYIAKQDRVVDVNLCGANVYCNRCVRFNCFTRKAANDARRRNSLGSNNWRRVKYERHIF